VLSTVQTGSSVFENIVQDAKIIVVWILQQIIQKASFVQKDVYLEIMALEKVSGSFNV
jgi:hypothetical protein